MFVQFLLILQLAKIRNFIAMYKLCLVKKDFN